MSCMFDSPPSVSSDSMTVCLQPTGSVYFQQPHHLLGRVPPSLPQKQGPNDDGASCTEIMGETSSPSVRRCFGHRPDLICAERQDAGCHLEALCVFVGVVGHSGITGDKLSDRFGAGHSARMPCQWAKSQFWRGRQCGGGRCTSNMNKTDFHWGRPYGWVTHPSTRCTLTRLAGPEYDF